MLLNYEHKLLQAAQELIDRLPVNEDHTVAAAAMDADGRIFTGVNVYHFSGGPCAELVTLGVAAAADSAPLISIVAVASQGRGILPPCGRCRQVLRDYFPDIGVIMPAWKDSDGPQWTRLHELLPGEYRNPDASSRPRTVYFSGRYYDDVVAGRKASTVRFNDPISLGSATFVFESDAGPRSLAGEVSEIQRMTMQSLMELEERKRGSGAGLRYLAALKGHYPQLLPSDSMTKVFFHLV